MKDEEEVERSFREFRALAKQRLAARKNTENTTTKAESNLNPLLFNSYYLWHTGFLLHLLSYSLPSGFVVAVLYVYCRPVSLQRLNDVINLKCDKQFNLPYHRHFVSQMYFNIFFRISIFCESCSILSSKNVSIFAPSM